MIKICNMLFEFHNAWGNVQDLYILRLIYVPITTAFVFLFSERALLLRSLWYHQRSPDLTRAPSSSSCWPCSVSVWGDIGRGQAQSRGEYLYSVWGGILGGDKHSLRVSICAVLWWGPRRILGRDQHSPGMRICVVLGVGGFGGIELYSQGVSICWGWGPRRILGTGRGPVQPRGE